MLIFDEATSALDGVIEAEVLEAILALTHTRTIVIVANRLTTVANCDLIYSVDSGGTLTKVAHEKLAIP